MFIIVFILCLSIVTTINNKLREISDENNDSYEFDIKSTIIISALASLGLLLNLTAKYFEDIYLIVLAAYAGLSVLSLLISNKIRLDEIEKKRKQMDQIYEILGNLVKESKKDTIDYNNIPFEIKFEKADKIDQIVVTINDPNKFNDSALTQAVYSMNKFLPYKQWVTEVNFPERECVFIGQNLPPEKASFPGSDLRPWNWIPLGVGGNGELGWNLGAKSENMGQSLYIYEDSGEYANTTSVSKAPQCLTVGATGGGKAIFIKEKVTIME